MRHRPSGLIGPPKASADTQVVRKLDSVGALQFVCAHTGTHVYMDIYRYACTHVRIYPYTCVQRYIEN